MEWVLPAEGSPLRAIATYAADHRLLPEAWIYGQLYVFKFLRRAAYLMGQVSTDGFLSYFPVAFAVKTPLPIVILLIASLWAIWRGGVDRRQALFLLIPAVVYFAAAVASRMNIGLRHILPIYPFLYVLIGGVAAWLWRRSRRFARVGLAALAVWYVASNVWIYPDYLAYFNESVGGPDNGYKILLDSNLDWGQDLKGLKLWMDRHQVKNIQLLEFGYSDAEYYGIDAVFLPGSWMVYDPPATRPAEKPRYVAASASILYSPFLIGPKAKVDFTKRFRSIKPIAKIGYSIFVYKADDVDANAR
jgi:hypothetical protein